LEHLDQQDLSLQIILVAIEPVCSGLLVAVVAETKMQMALKEQKVKVDKVQVQVDLMQVLVLVVQHLQQLADLEFMLLKTLDLVVVEQHIVLPEIIPI
tara:strand:- start:28 stop:321 length:294 start_codon:yes stop_codon:yes gene_type:complete